MSSFSFPHKVIWKKLENPEYISFLSCLYYFIVKKHYNKQGFCLNVGGMVTKDK